MLRTMDSYIVCPLCASSIWTYPLFPFVISSLL